MVLDTVNNLEMVSCAVIGDGMKYVCKIVREDMGDRERKERGNGERKKRKSLVYFKFKKVEENSVSVLIRET